ncbi:MAG: shikimate kinase [Clostridia bacterium]|nr:shikimate kinase [Clostridia bacterium]
MIHRKELRCGLIGNPLGHSYSPEIHALLADYEYRLFPLEEEEVAPFLAARAFDAINVTIPYKKTVMPYLDEISPEARRIGSVNTIVRDGDGRLLGYNTDYAGFSFMLRRRGIALSGKKVLILGSGGACATVKTVAEDAGAESVTVIGRRDNNPQTLVLHAGAEVLINTTPVGMFPNNGQSPVDLSLFPRLEAVADVIYNPARTALILDAEQKGVKTASGLPMLVAQAKAAAELFTGEHVPDEETERIIRAVSLVKRNIALIGMPGAGKSTLGRALARQLGRDFVDLDDEIVKAAGKPIPEIFAEDGEPAFRDLESACLAQISARSSLVIATGGGAVIRAENRRLLRQNSTAVLLRRPLGELDSNGRPLSKLHSAEELWAARRAYYESAADAEITVEPDVSRSLEKLLAAIEAADADA